MDNQKAKMLGENLAHYKRMQENGTVDIIEFHTTDGQKFGIGNVAAIQLLLSVAVTELERQLHTARFGDIPERLEESREYKTARKLEHPGFPKAPPASVFETEHIPADTPHIPSPCG